MSTRDRIVIVGAGGHGRGVLEVLRAAAASKCEECPAIGFLDEDPAVFSATPGGLLVFGDMREVPRLLGEGCRFLIGVGEPQIRRKVATRLAEAGASFSVAIHPTAALYGDVHVAPGSVIAAGVVVAAATNLQEHVLLNLNATVGHDCVLAPFATVGPGANIGGNVRMGECAFVGLNGTVLPGRSLGANSQLGAGSVLLEDLPANSIAFGVPARVVGRSEEQ